MRGVRSSSCWKQERAEATRRLCEHKAIVTRTTLGSTFNYKVKMQLRKERDACHGSVKEPPRLTAPAAETCLAPLTYKTACACCLISHS